MEPPTTPGSHSLSWSSPLSLEEDLDINIPLGTECSRSSTESFQLGIVIPGCEGQGLALSPVPSYPPSGSRNTVNVHVQIDLPFKQVLLVTCFIFEIFFVCHLNLTSDFDQKPLSPLNLLTVLWSRNLSKQVAVTASSSKFKFPTFYFSWGKCIFPYARVCECPHF